MSWVRFNHVFAALLVLSALSAFVIPERYTTKAQPQLQGLFYPVARPTRSIAAALHGRLSKPEPGDPRDTRTIAGENDQLRQELVALDQEIGELRRRLAEREKLGALGEQCTPVKVVGEDTGNREGLSLQGSTIEGLKQGQPVLFAGGVVGRLDRPPGLTGAMVRLITDKGIRVGAYFGRFEKDANGELTFQRIETSPPLLEGTGDGAMRCATMLTMAEVRPEDPKDPKEAKRPRLEVGDWVFLEDQTLGKVVLQTPGIVKLVLLGGSQRIVNTPHFMAQSPTVLSTGFRLQTLFGLDYQHQAEVTRAIPAQLATRIEQALIREGHQGHLVHIAVEFEEAGVSALHVRILADFAGAAAPSFHILRRALQRLCVEACHDCGWVIPFTQVTLHMASAADHQALPDLDGASTQEDR